MSGSSSAAVNVVRDNARVPRSDRAGSELNLTDTGNARRLVSRAGNRIRWLSEAKTWLYCSDDQLWERDTTQELVRLAQESARSLLLQAALPNTHPEVAKDFARHGIKSASRQKLIDAIELAKAEPGISISTEALDADPWLLSVRNGIVDLRTGCIRDRIPADLVTKCVAADFDPNAECPRFIEFLGEVMQGNDEMVAFLQRLVGYSLFGGNPNQKLAILVGVGANGKSTLLQVLVDLLSSYAQTTPAETFMARRDGAASNDLARLRGARLVSATEAEQGRRLAENLVKRLTGNDRVAARFLFAEFFEFVPQFLAFLAVNHKPVVSGDDPAIWRRLLVIPFTYVVPPEKRDSRLAEKLLEERNGILAWAVAGCLQWRQVGLAVPQACEAAASEYRREMDILGTWIEERAVILEGVSARADALYRDYADWCRENGHGALTSTRFGITLGERGYDKKRSAAGLVYRGIGLQLENRNLQ